MATYPLMFEGFEVHNPTLDMSQFSELKQFLGTSTSDGDDADDVIPGSGTVTVIDTDQRVTPGSSLEIDRPNNTGDSLTTIPRFSFDFVARQKVAMGLGVKYDGVPTSPIPIMGFNYTTAFGLEEQIALWVGVTGNLYVSSIDVALTTAAQATPAPIAEGSSSEKAFRFEEWMYVEMQLDLLAVTPTLSILCNGIYVVDGIPLAGFQKITADAYISNAMIYVPPMNWFTNDTELKMTVDDIYLTHSDLAADSAVLGPQQILPLLWDNVISSDFATSAPATLIGAAGAALADDFADQIVFDLTNPNPAINGNVTGVQVSALAENAAGTSLLEFGGGDTNGAADRDFFNTRTLGTSIGLVLGRAVSFGPVGVLATTVDGYEAMFISAKSSTLV